MLILSSIVFYFFISIKYDVTCSISTGRSRNLGSCFLLLLMLPWWISLPVCRGKINTVWRFVHLDDGLVASRSNLNNFVELNFGHVIWADTGAFCRPSCEREGWQLCIIHTLLYCTWFEVLVQGIGREENSLDMLFLHDELCYRFLEHHNTNIHLTFVRLIMPGCVGARKELMQKLLMFQQTILSI